MFELFVLSLDHLVRSKSQETDDEMCLDPIDFRVHCKCTECLQYREMLILLILEDHEYNMLWDRLRTLIREFYDVVPQ